MRKRSILVLTSLAALAAALAMPWLAWREAQRQAFDAEAEMTQNLARNVLHRADQTAQQARDGIARLAASKLAPCSAPLHDIMRRIDLGSTNIQAIGYLEHGALVCSSLGQSPVPLGPVSFRTSTGYDFYLNVPGQDPAGALMAIAHGPWAVLIHRDLPLDVGPAASSVALSVVHLERPRVTLGSCARGRDCAPAGAGRAADRAGAGGSDPAAGAPADVARGGPAHGLAPR